MSSNKIYSDEITEIEEKVREILSTEEGETAFANSLAEYCLANLSPESRKVYDLMLETFSDITREEEMGGLSILTMEYPMYMKNCSYEDIIKEHDRLFVGWKPNRVEQWVALMISSRMPSCFS